MAAFRIHFLPGRWNNPSNKGMMTPKRRWLLAVCALSMALSGGYFLYTYLIGREAANEADLLLSRFEGTRTTFLQLDREVIAPISGKANPRLLRATWPVVAEKALTPEILQEFRARRLRTAGD